jgi:hypothetical protein
MNVFFLCAVIDSHPPTYEHTAPCEHADTYLPPPQGLLGLLALAWGELPNQPPPPGTLA